MSTAKINRFIQIFSDAFSQLSADVPIQDIEFLSMLIHRAMENRTRKYHTSMHVFKLCEGLSARPQLAALFHDLVYYQLDNGFPQQTVSLLSHVCHPENGGFILQEINHHLLAMCAEIFNFKPYSPLPLYGGMNEFLSAVVAVKLLSPYLPMQDLIAIVACIEATIPFREANSTSSPSRLAERVQQQSRKLLSTLNAEETDQYVAKVMQDAISLSNIDVGGFAEINPGKFLSSTWLLIEESNAPLNAVGAYTLQDYRMALLRMEKFLHGLKAEVVFHQYANLPDAAEHQRLTDLARGNLLFSCDFLAAKLTAIAIIEALAIETGGDCPVSMFLGDIHSTNGKPKRAEDFLPQANTTADIKPELLHVFEQGRSEETDLDLNASPLTAFLYRSLGHQGTLQAWQQAQHLFAGSLSPLNFLRSLDHKLVMSMIEACMHIAISRKNSLLALQQTLNTPEK
jgi:hypothetical protein